MVSNRKIELRSGRIVYVRALRQWQFYEGLLEGLPTVEMNRQGLEHILAEERGKSYGADPLLIPPKETPIPYDGRYPFGAPASLPEIVCVARLSSLQPAGDRSKDTSGLGIVWFQHEFAFPIEPDVLEQLRAIEWEQHAVDMEY